MVRAVVVVALLLAGCAGSPPPHALGAAAREYFPMQPGAHWVYDLRTGFWTHTQLDVTARGEAPVRGSEHGIFIMEERASGEMYGLEPDGLVGYRVTDDYVTRIPGVEIQSNGEVHVISGNGASVMPIHPEPGQHWSEDIGVFDGSNAAPQSWTAELAHVGRMSVPAGTFDDVIVVRSAHWDREWRESEPLHTYEDYYARGVGLIRSVAHNHTHFLPYTELDQVLTEVSFETGSGATAR
jgi:hypothetical protein